MTFLSFSKLVLVKYAKFLSHLCTSLSILEKKDLHKFIYLLFSSLRTCEDSMQNYQSVPEGTVRQLLPRRRQDCDRKTRNSTCHPWYGGQTGCCQPSRSDPDCWSFVWPTWTRPCGVHSVLSSRSWKCRRCHPAGWETTRDVRCPRFVL